MAKISTLDMFDPILFERTNNATKLIEQGGEMLFDHFNFDPKIFEHIACRGCYEEVDFLKFQDHLEKVEDLAKLSDLVEYLNIASSLLREESQKQQFIYHTNCIINRLEN